MTTETGTAFSQIKAIFKVHQITLLNSFNSIVNILKKNEQFERRIILKKDIADLQDSIKFHGNKVHESKPQIKPQQ